MNIESQVTKKLDKLARMVLAGVAQTQIAAANGLTEGRISQILQTEEYKAREEMIAAEKFEEIERMNKGWDGVEQLGVQRVLQALQHDPEPEFALRAAAVANKASRRGGNRDISVNTQNAGVRAVLHLKATFVERLEQNFQITENKQSVFLEKKDSDFLGAKGVQDLLMEKTAREGMSETELLIETGFNG